MVRKQPYPEKALYRNWQLVEIPNETKLLEDQLSDWHRKHKNFVIVQHQYRTFGKYRVLAITYFNVDEAEAEIKKEYRTPRNNFYLKTWSEPLESRQSKEIDKWYDENDYDIISKSFDIDPETNSVNYGIIYVDRKEAAEAWDKKQENQLKMQQELANKMAGLKPEDEK